MHTFRLERFSLPNVVCSVCCPIFWRPLLFCAVGDFVDVKSYTKISAQDHAVAPPSAVYKKYVCVCSIYAAVFEMS